MGDFSESAHITLQKEEFSYAYINSISTISGYECSVKKRFMDHAGIDLSVEVPGELNTCLSPRFDAQVKCTSQDCIKNDHLVYENLSIENYKRLIHPNPSSTQLLIIVIVPKDLPDWIQIDNGVVIKTKNDIETIFKSGAFYISLKGQKQSENAKTKTVKIPVSQRLTPISLREIMIKIAQNEEP